MLTYLLPLEVHRPVTYTARIPIVTPSEADHESAIEQLKDVISDPDKSVAYFSELGYNLSAGDVRNEATSALQRFTHDDRRVGLCIASSEMTRLAPQRGCRLDWALIEKSEKDKHS